MLVFQLIMMVSFLLCIGISYFTLRSQARHQKGLLLGVTLPPEADALPEVQQTLRRFRTSLNGVCLLCCAACIPLFFLHDTALLLTLWMLLLYVGMAAPVLPFWRANRELKALKKAHGWQQNRTPRIVDTGASETALPKPIGLWSLLLPLAVSLLPALLPGQPGALRLVYLLDSASLALLWCMGRWMFRRRADMVTAETARNQALLRVRRLAWDRLWRLNLWALAGMNLFIGLFWQSDRVLLVGTLFFALLVCLASLWVEFSVRRTQERLTADAAILADEDDAWLGGILYYDPADQRTLVAKRLGIGTTVNFASKGGKVYLAFLAVVLLGCLAIGPVLAVADGIPTRLQIETVPETQLVALHGSSAKYTLPVDSITDVELRSSLPPCSRTWGTGMEHYLSGSFYVTGEGNAQFCLDPTASVFLRVEADGKTYWFTADSDAQTEAITQMLEQADH